MAAGALWRLARHSIRCTRQLANEGRAVRRIFMWANHMGRSAFYGTHIRELLTLAARRCCTRRTSARARASLHLHLNCIRLSAAYFFALLASLALGRWRSSVGRLWGDIDQHE